MRGNRIDLVTPDDYPDASLRNGEQGRVTILYDVNEAGRPENCRITESSGFDRLDATTCMLAMRRLRYWPAVANGTPVRGSSDLTLRWLLPEDTPPPPVADPVPR